MGVEALKNEPIFGNLSAACIKSDYTKVQ